MSDEKVPQEDQKDPEAEMTEEQQGEEQSGTDVQTELERTRKALAKANREAAERRKKLEAYEAEEQKRREAEMSELEKAQEAARAAEAEKQAALQRASEMVLRSSIITEAAALNFADPNDAYVLLDKSDLIVEEGKVEGLSDALKALAESKPYMIRADKNPPKLGAANPGGGANPAGETDAERRYRLGLA